MTGVEKLNRIKMLQDKGDLFMTCQDYEEICELRKDIKVSDFFKWLAINGDEICKEQKFLKLMGTDGFNCTCSWNSKLEEAIINGYVKRDTVRNYGRYSHWISLTKKGSKVLEER